MHKHTQNHKTERQCEIDGCGKKHLAKGYCRQHYRAIANPDKPRDRRTLITCIDCGAEALKHYGTKTCLERCQPCARSHGAKNGMTGKTRESLPQWPKSNFYAGYCAYCKQAFSSRVKKKYCNTWCCTEANAERSGSRDRNCKRCGDHLGRVSLDWYCTPCRGANQRESRKAHKRKRRAWKKQSPCVETVSPSKVYARDNWTCGICCLAVDPGCAYPDKLSPSIDHIVPLAHGGHHTYENVQLAHLHCNMLKGDTLIGSTRGRGVVA